MKITFGYYFFAIFLMGISCNTDLSDKERFLVDQIPKERPVTFMQELSFDNKIIHKGVFSPDYMQYYFVLSEKDFTHFDIYVINKEKEKWSQPQRAFFDTQYNEHGISFSSDGNTIYFSSTRPVVEHDIPDTWHIWKSNKVNGKWTVPEYVDIPNLRNKLTSHPTVTDKGTLYFHSSDLDYSNMDIYYANRDGDIYGKAQKIDISEHNKLDKSTPFVSPSGDFLIYASVAKELDLWILYKDTNGKWSKPKAFSDFINTDGQGNPFITPDFKYMLYTTRSSTNNEWAIKWVNVEGKLKGKP